MSDLETTNCPLCGAGQGVPVYGGAGFAPYGLVGCPACGLQYLSPRLTEPAMAAHYASDRYFQGGTQGYDDLRRSATHEPLGRGVRPAVASLGDHGRMLAALDRERDREALRTVRRLIELERARLRSRDRGLSLER